MNQRALATLGLLLGVAHGTRPDEWLTGFHRWFREKQSSEPASAAVHVVLVGAALFYVAERGANPKVRSFYDALVYSSTNISVGYCDILACTSLGKAVGTVLMTYGPAIATRALDAPAAESPMPATDTGLNVLAGKLDQILDELVRQRTSASPAS